MKASTNYSQLCEGVIAAAAADGRTPKLLLHGCCAPCSSYVLEYLSEHFEITLLFYNPNISSAEEYNHRADELLRLVQLQPHKNKVQVALADYRPQEFYTAADGLEHCEEGGARCAECFALRLGYTAVTATQQGFDYFCSTLTISPLKNAELINSIGERMAARYNVLWLPSDFKKKNGFKRSVELSAEYGLYRQSFCGCSFSEK